MCKIFLKIVRNFQRKYYYYSVFFVNVNIFLPFYLKMITRREKIAAAINFPFFEQKTKKPKRMEQRNWIQSRKFHGAYYDALSQELRMEEDPSQLRNLIRMSAEDFEELSSWFAPIVQKMNANMSQAISVG